MKTRIIFSSFLSMQHHRANALCQRSGWWDGGAAALSAPACPVPGAPPPFLASPLHTLTIDRKRMSKGQGHTQSPINYKNKTPIIPIHPDSFTSSEYIERKRISANVNNLQNEYGAHALCELQTQHNGPMKCRDRYTSRKYRTVSTLRFYWLKLFRGKTLLWSKSAFQPEVQSIFSQIWVIYAPLKGLPHISDINSYAFNNIFFVNCRHTHEFLFGGSIKLFFSDGPNLARQYTGAYTYFPLNQREVCEFGRPHMNGWRKIYSGFTWQMFIL